jgi:hypothetical protein
MHKYGIESFICEEVAVAYSREELDQLEAQYIEEHKTYDIRKGYNKRKGGNNAPIVNNIHRHKKRKTRKKKKTNKDNI